MGELSPGSLLFFYLPWAPLGVALVILLAVRLRRTAPIWVARRAFAACGRATPRRQRTASIPETRRRARYRVAGEPRSARRSSAINEFVRSRISVRSSPGWRAAANVTPLRSDTGRA